MLVLGAVWGASFLFMRIAAPEFGPLALVLVRTGVAALCLIPFLFYKGEFKQVLGSTLVFLWLGAITVALPFTLFSYASLYLNAGSTSLLNATTPMFGALIAWLWLKEPITRYTVVGVLLGFAGVFVISASKKGGFAFRVLPVLATLLATACYAYGSCFARKFFSGFRAATIAAGGQLGAALCLLPFGLYYWPQQNPSALAWLSTILLAVFCTALALILFFHLLKKVGVSRAISVTYLTPVFGILWGVVFLSESPGLSLIIGGVLVLFGVTLTNLNR